MAVAVAAAPVATAWGESCDPPGNYLAARLRHVYDDTKSIFPESNYSTVSGHERRWKSVVKSDFVPVADWRDSFRKTYKPMTSLPLERPKHRPKKMFMSWKVPSRLTESYDGDSRQGSARGDFDIQPTVAIPPNLNPDKIPTPTHVGDMGERGFAHHATLDTPQPPSRHQSARELYYGYVPDIAAGPIQPRPPTVGSVQRPSSRIPATPRIAPTPKPPARMDMTSRQAPSMHKSTRKHNNKELMKKDILKSYQRHNVPQTDDHWFKGGPELDKKLVDKALPTEAGNKGSMSADFGTSVHQWIKNASPSEKDMALEFFGSMAGAKMLGGKMGDMKKVAEMIQQGTNAEEDRGNLRYLRLLTPDTRRTKWQHQTWHHLPNHRDFDPVANKSAIYTQPHKHISRHFTIHPDWGES